MDLTRRHLLVAAAARASVASPEASSALGAQPSIALSPLLLFSKPLGDLPVPKLAAAAREIGFDGVDLTVRRAGHVAPGQVKQDLPEAARIIRATGLSLPLITTELTSGSDPAARPVLETAHSLGISFFKPGYRPYGKGALRDQIGAIERDTLALAAVAREFHMVMGIHNHSGFQWGQAVSDIQTLVDRLPGDPCGYYFDGAHATIEGGLGGWRVSLEMVLPRLRLLAVKDFVWEKRDGRWQVTWVPLGQGMVRWPEIFSALRAFGFHGPISLHVEYEEPDRVGSIARDFAALKALVHAAASPVG